MSIGVRLGSALLLSGLLWLPVAPVRAETSTWTDPPAREEASGNQPAAAPSAGPSAQSGPSPEPGRAATAERAGGGKARGDRRGADPAKTGRTEAEAPRRTIAARPRAKAVPARRTAAVPRPARTVVADRAPRRIAEPRIRPRPVEARRTFVPSGDGARFTERSYPASARRAGWEGLLGDERAQRIERAREAGYLVMRAREVVYPDGRVVRTLHPLGPNSLGPMGEGGPD